MPDNQRLETLGSSILRYISQSIKISVTVNAIEPKSGSLESVPEDGSEKQLTFPLPPTICNDK